MAEHVAEVQDYGAVRRRSDMRPLRELLPLDTPLSLMVDPSNGCNFRCVFCPTGDPQLLRSVGRKSAVMRPEAFSKLVDGLRKFLRPVEVLHLYKDGEPLLNKWLAELISIARRSGRFERIETTTNGAFLTADRAAELIEAGIDGIRISVYGLDDRSYRANVGVAFKFETVVQNVTTLFALKSAKRPQLHVHCKIIDTGLSRADKQRFIDTFSPIADSVHIDSLTPWGNGGDRDEILGRNAATGMTGAPIRLERKACSEPFMRLAVNSNGKVSVCCVDWAHETTVGDVNEQSLFEIWHGEPLRQFRLRHLMGQRKSIKPCASCHYVLGLNPKNDFDDRLEALIPEYAG
jgi:radical SAM protein with 4Fe4S-binding SPASM domain